MNKKSIIWGSVLVALLFITGSVISKEANNIKGISNPPIPSTAVGSGSNWLVNASGQLTPSTTIDVLLPANATSSHLAVTEMCLGSDCKTSWPTAGVASWDDLTNKPATSTVLNLLDTENRIAVLNSTTTNIGTLTVYNNATIGGNATTTGNQYVSGETSLMSRVGIGVDAPSDTSGAMLEINHNWAGASTVHLFNSNTSGQTYFMAGETVADGKNIFLGYINTAIDYGAGYELYAGNSSIIDVGYESSGLNVVAEKSTAYIQFGIGGLAAVNKVLGITAGHSIFYNAVKIPTLNATTTNIGTLLTYGTSTIANTGTLKTNRILQVGNTAEHHYIPSGGDGSAFIVVDKPNAASDASLLLSSTGDVKWEIGMAGDTNLFWKKVTGTEATGYTFENVFKMDYDNLRVGIGTEAPSSKLEIASSSPTARVDLRVTNKATSGTDGASIQLVAENDGHVLYMGTDAGLNGGQNFFLNWGSFGTGLFMDASGNIGINDTSLSNNFEVTGTSLFTGLTAITDGRIAMLNSTTTKVDNLWAKSATTTESQYVGSGRIWDTQEKCFTLASTTWASVKTDIPLWHPYRAITVVEERGIVIGGTSAVLTLSDGTNNMDALTAATTLTKDSSLSNNSWIADELMQVDVGTITGAVDYANVCIIYRYD